MGTQKRMNELIIRLSEASEAYYGYDDPIMTDHQYNALYDELEQLEKQTGIVLSNSPTQKVQGVVIDSLKKVQFVEPMLSADKTKNIDKIIAFAGGHEIITSYKLDGLTLVLRYKDGKLVQAVTRGEGTAGEDVTDAVKMVKNVPLTITETGDLTVRGECLMPWDSYLKIQKKYEEEGKECGHPRNLASGGIRQLNTDLVKERGLQFIAFAIVQSETEKQFRLKQDQLSFLSLNGFMTIASVGVELCLTSEQIRGTLDHFKAELCPYPVDGIIYEFNDLVYGSSLGATSHHTNNLMAFKWADNTYLTSFTGIELNATRTGIVSMTALFEPVEINHTSVSRALIPNIEYFEKYRLGLGDTLEVYKANNIIPQIEKNRTKSGTYSLPDTCPSCGELLEVRQPGKSRLLYCSNKKCPAKQIQKFVHFASRDRMNIVGMSEATLEKFVERGWIKSFADIYRLDRYRADIISMDGFGEQSYRKLWKSIQDSRATKLSNVIAALGIPYVGRTAGKIISQYFKGHEYNFMNAVESGFPFDILDGIGPVQNQSIHTWFADSGTTEWNALSSFLEMALIKDTPATENVFSGKTIVPTGTLNHFTRESIKQKIEEIGAKAGSSVSSKTDYVLAGEKAGSKLAKGKQLGITIISEEEFIEMAGIKKN